MTTSRPRTRVFPISPIHEIRAGDALELALDPVTLGGAEHFKPERLILSDAINWKIVSVKIDDREQLDQELPGALFAPEAPVGARWLDTLHNGSEFRLSATYQGGAAAESYLSATYQSADVGRFRAVLMGFDVSPSHDPRAFSGPIRFRDEATGEPIAVACDGPARVLPGASAWFVARPLSCALRVEKIVLDFGGTEWTIEDICVGGRTQFAQAVALPGELFAPGMADARLALDPVLTAGEFAIKAIYRGTNPRGRFFGATCACRIAR